MKPSETVVSVPTQYLYELLDSVDVLARKVVSDAPSSFEVCAALTSLRRLSGTLKCAADDATETGPSEVFNAADRLRLVASALGCEEDFNRDPHAVVGVASRTAQRLKMYVRFAADVEKIFRECPAPVVRSTDQIGANGLHSAVDNSLRALREVDR